MKKIETKYINFYRRIFDFKNFDLFASVILFSYSISQLSNQNFIILEIILFLFFFGFTIYRSKTNIHKITFDKNNIILDGETFIKKWSKTINVKETKINLKTIPSRIGICGATFFIELKNMKDNYILNSFQTFSDMELIEIFNEFKKLKEEKIIIDESLLVNRIHEKIKKC